MGLRRIWWDSIVASVPMHIRPGVTHIVAIPIGVV